MENYELDTSIENLQSNEELEVKIAKKKKSKTPPYLTVGNGKTNRHFKDDPVVDAFKAIGSLSPQQLEIFLHFRDLIVDKNILASNAKSLNKQPNTITLSKSSDDLDAQRVKKLLRTNNNGRNMQEQSIIKKIKTGVYMVNPYILIPSDNFKDVVDEWNSIS